jgi:hypothetical protein
MYSTRGEERVEGRGRRSGTINQNKTSRRRKKRMWMSPSTKRSDWKAQLRLARLRMSRMYNSMDLQCSPLHLPLVGC